MMPCLEPGCPVLTNRGRCERHRLERLQAQPQKYTLPAYRTVVHRQWAKAIKRRDRFCVDPYNRHPNAKRPATIADHIRPLKAGGTYSLANGRGVCRSCHEYGKAMYNKSL